MGIMRIMDAVSGNEIVRSLIAEYLPLSGASAAECEKIEKAVRLLVFHTEGMVRSCGAPYYLHPMRIAAILLKNNMDTPSICAGILHSAPDIGISNEEIETTLDAETARLANGVSRIKNLSLRTGQKARNTLVEADAVRKMLFAMVDDVRVILIKMADRLDRIRNIRNIGKSRQKQLAEEVIDIWAPLADRLGMQAEKNEFEDLSLKYSNPAVYAQIKAIVSQKKEEREVYLKAAEQSIKAKALDAGIECVIKSRAKHFYSIYQKMRKRGKEASELFDLFAIRIICNEVPDCYTLVGIVHGLWQPLDGRFKDYIAMPKANGYRSLHTTVMCAARPLEIQIRTAEMDALAEHGVASHWLYKKGTNRDKVDISNLAIFNELKHWREEDTGEGAFDRLKQDILGDEIYVFTPKGEVISLPIGSTAIDFAYRIHSSIGEKAVGAKADGKIIPLLKPLSNTQIIEVITDPRAHPTEAWLKACRTSKARQKIHAWLVANKVMEADEKHGEASPRDERRTETPAAPKAPQGTRSGGVPSAPLARAAQKAVIEGEANCLHCFAKCCHPQAGDAIVGFVSRARGIVIHRASCLVYQRIPDKEKRTVKVEWQTP